MMYHISLSHMHQLKSVNVTYCKNILNDTKWWNLYHDDYEIRNGYMCMIRYPVEPNTWYSPCFLHIMTSSNGNIFRVTGPFWGESTGHQWIPFTKAGDAELWTNSWVNNRDAGGLRRHRAHYDVIAMRGAPDIDDILFKYRALLV